MSAPSAAGSGEAAARPRNWDKMVSAAYLRLTGEPQVRAAKAAGVSERTLRDWEKGPLWPDAESEARSRWLNGIADAARRAVYRSVHAGNADLGFRVLERLEPALAPPKVRGEVAVTTFDGMKLLEDPDLFRARDEALSKVLAVGG